MFGSADAVIQTEIICVSIFGVLWPCNIFCAGSVKTNMTVF